MLAFPEIGDPYGTILRETLVDPQRALERAQGLRPSPTSLEELGLAAYTYGCCLIACERFDLAHEPLAQASRYLTMLPDSAMVLYCRHAQQFGALFSDQPTEIEPWQDLIEEYLQRRLREAAALAAVALGRALYQRRDLSQLEALITTWLPAEGNASLPFVHGNLVRLQGLIALNRGQFAETDRQFRHAVTIFEQGDCPLEAAHCLLDLAWSRLLQGDISIAHRLLTTADAVFTRHDLPLRQALCAHNLSITYLQHGEFAQAIHMAQKARQLFEEIGRPLNIGNSNLQLGRIYIHIGHWTAAIGQMLSAITLYERFAINGRMASCYYNLAVALTGKGDYNEAISTIQIAERFATDEGNLEVLRELVFLQAIILAQSGQTDRAYNLLDQIGDVFATSGQPLGQARCLLEQGWLDERRGAFDRAHTYFIRAQELLAEHPVYQWRALYGLARCQEHAGEYNAALVSYDQAVKQIASFRRQLANEHLSSLMFLQAEALFDDALSCTMDQGPAEQVVRLIEYHRAVTLQRLLDMPLHGIPTPDLDGLQGALLAMIKRWPLEDDTEAFTLLGQHLHTYAERIWLNRHAIPLVEPTKTAPDPDLVNQRLSALHGANWTLVSFLVHRERLIITIQMPDSILVRQVAWDNKIETLIRHLGDPSRQWRIYNDIAFHQRQTEQRWEPLAQLAARLFPPEVRERLGGNHRLYIVPSGVLHMLAWGSLRVGDHWLCECAVVHILPYMMFALRHAKPPRGAMLQLACSDFAGRAPALPETEQELRAISAIWPMPADALVNERCTVAAISDPTTHLETYGIIHIASHAYMSMHHGLAGHILTYDGELWLDKISRLRLKDALVFLSGCNGAVIDSMPGEEAVSLPWGWLSAGAQAIVATLWPMFDGSTIPLIAGFYRRLAEGMDVALALALSQREQAADEGQLPIMWGNVVSIGAPMMVFQAGAGGTKPASFYENATTRED